MSEGEVTHGPGQSPGAKINVPEVKAGAGVSGEGSGMLAFKGSFEKITAAINQVLARHGGKSAKVQGIASKEVGSGTEPSKN